MLFLTNTCPSLFWTSLKKCHSRRSGIYVTCLTQAALRSYPSTILTTYQGLGAAEEQYANIWKNIRAAW